MNYRNSYAIRVRLVDFILDVDYLIEVDPGTVTPFRRFSFTQDGTVRQYAILPDSIPNFRGLFEYLEDFIPPIETVPDPTEDVYLLPDPVPQYWHDAAMQFIANM
jgi:hypothetical protein